MIRCCGGHASRKATELNLCFPPSTSLLNSISTNVNDPIIQFTTRDGQTITGKPVVGYITQYEVSVPQQVNIVYNAKNPKEFYIDWKA